MLRREICDKIRGEIIEKDGVQLRAEAELEVRHQFRNEVDDQVKEAFYREESDRIKNWMWNSMYADIKKEVTKDIQKELELKYRNALLAELSKALGQ